MAARIIKLKRAATCHDCGAHIPAGTQARWYRSGAVYGLTCHGQQTASALDHKQRASGEDYPCSDLGYEDACAAACGVGL
jgi:hypothetical protein